MPSPDARFHPPVETELIEAGRRTPGQRDADRILYSYGFQRLAGITQVTGTEAGAILHSRLTHSLKVAQVARRITERLLAQMPDRAARHELDPDVAEAAALAHDLGHPPFGHVAEHKLDELAAGWGGFNGNAQSFRIVTQLEHKRIEYSGLNLTRRTLRGILKYPWMRGPDGKRHTSWGAYDTESDIFEWATQGVSDGVLHPLAAIMDWADDVTYAVHDVEDFFRAGLVPLERLGSRIHSDRHQVVEHAAAKLDVATADLAELAEQLFEFDFSWDRGWVGSKDDRQHLHSDTSGLLERLIFAVHLGEDGSITIGETERQIVAILKALTWRYVIDRSALTATQQGQQDVIEGLHEYFLRELRSHRDTPEGRRYRAFPRVYRDLLHELGGDPDDPATLRLITDVIAGMTEETAYQLFGRIRGHAVGSILDATARSIR